MGYNTIDVNVALEQLGGSEKLYKTVVKGFYERYSDVDRHIETLLLAVDLEEARRLAHSMKGLCGNLGAFKLRQRALDLELAIKNNEPNIQAYLHCFSEELALVVSDVIHILEDRFDMTLTTTEDECHCGKACQALVHALKTYRYSDITEAVAQIKLETSDKNVLSAALVKAFELIGRFDYDEALKTLEKECIL